MGTTSKSVAALGVSLLLVGCAYAPSFSEEEKIEMRDNTSEYQRAVLEDLIVTETQYRDAINALCECVQDAGWGVEGIQQKDNQLGFQSSYSGPNPPANERRRACDDEYISEIGPIWVSQRKPLTQ